ncbi:MAG: hypothetical protein A4E63_01273 [Syntrophorhabdus sp. PtaU1.Bin050]|nr:MAG: hypothetical protein A4E63_01273 [Syntrophorhabdus sp. PtaU1.Bin050]
MNPTARYQQALDQIPPGGCGRNCHTSILGVANYGVKAGVPSQQIFDNIRCHIPQGSRRVPDKEIRDAINKALENHNKGSFVPKARPVAIVKDGSTALRHIANQSDIKDEADLWEASPIRLLDEPKSDPALLLRTLFDDDDYLFIGERYQSGILGDTIRTVKEWITFFETGGKTVPHILINPLTGRPAPKESGEGETYRGNGNVAAYRYCLVEFDTINIEDQIGFFTSVRLPIVALIHTGGKSVHAWVDVSKLVEVKTREQWDTEIKGRLYDRLLTPLGVDAACSNPARLSRLPGHFREEKGQYQKLLWLRGRQNGSY